MPANEFAGKQQPNPKSAEADYLINLLRQVWF